MMVAKVFFSPITCSARHLISCYTWNSGIYRAWCWIPQFPHSPHGLWQSPSFFAEIAGQLTLHCNEPSLWCPAMRLLNAVSLFVPGTHSLFQVMHGCPLQCRFRVRCRSGIKSFAVGLQLWKLRTTVFLSCVAVFVRGGFWGFEDNLLEISNTVIRCGKRKPERCASGSLTWQVVRLFRIM